MSDYTPTTAEVRGDYAHFQVPGGTDPVTGEFAEGLAEFDRWLAEVERAAAGKALTEMANELALLDDGGKRGLAGHSKSSASAITHRHAVAVIRARAEAYRQERGEQ